MQHNTTVPDEKGLHRPDTITAVPPGADIPHNSIWQDNRPTCQITIRKDNLVVNATERLPSWLPITEVASPSPSQRRRFFQDIARH